MAESLSPPLRRHGSKKHFLHNRIFAEYKECISSSCSRMPGRGAGQEQEQGEGAQQDVQLCDGNRKCANSRALRIFTLSTILHGIGAVAACRAQCQLSGSIYISIAYIPIFSCQQIRHSTGRTGAEQQCSWQATMPLDSRYAFVFSLYSDVVTHPAAQSMQAFNWVTRKSVERWRVRKSFQYTNSLTYTAPYNLWPKSYSFFFWHITGRLWLLTDTDATPRKTRALLCVRRTTTFRDDIMKQTVFAEEAGPAHQRPASVQVAEYPRLITQNRTNVLCW